MKKILLLILLLPIFFIVNATGGAPPVSPFKRQLSLQEFVKLTPKQYEKLTGKKLKFKEKIGLKLYQWKVKRKMNGEASPKQIRQGRLSLIFGALALVCIFIPVGIIGLIGLGLAAAGLVLGLKSIKGNSNIMGILGVVFSSLVVVLLLIAVVVVASWGWI